VKPDIKTVVVALSILLMLGGVFLLGNVIPRTEFLSTSCIFATLFGLMGLVFSLAKEPMPWVYVFITGLVLRFSLLVAIPQWSDDYARFLWDGELLRMGENPYAETPADFIQRHPNTSAEILHQLFPLLNSPGYYSVYPPINQGIFWLVANAADSILNQIIGLRLLLLLGEVGVFLLFRKLLTSYQLPQKLIWLYWLNPLVIMEITGNLHFEGLVLLLLLAALVSLKEERPFASGSLWGLAVGVKLLPMLLLPAFVFYPGTRKNTRFWTGASVAVLLSFFWLLLDSSWINFFQSLKLYQGKFEFNASIYYLLREVGFWLVGYNTIAVLSKLLTVLTLLLVIYFSWKKKPANLSELMDLWVLVYLLYLFLQPVVHPWYLIPALGLSVLTRRNTFLIWSFAAMVSYQAYSGPVVKESGLYLGIEYLLVLGGVYLDYFLPKAKHTFTS
jgi:alpha-1,6-mannosyltransferase